MFLQYTAVVATVAFEFAVTIAIVNFFGTIWGTGRQAMANLPIRWIYTGMIFCFVASLQGALQVTPTLQAFIHFSDWGIGHAYVLVFGVFMFWLMGVMTYLFPQLWRRPWHSPALCHWHYWLSTVGVVLLLGDLLVVGTLQGCFASLLRYHPSLDPSRPFFPFRVLADLTIFTGQLCFFYNIYRTWNSPLPAEEPAQSAAALTSQE
jgi:cytochrome c oxidase cbb3-type subunit 1